MKNLIRIATRNSPLAMWQAEFVKERLEKHHKNLEIRIIGITTKGDRILEKSLSKIGGKGLFVKELETSLLENKTDIAVHSMKDVGVNFPKELEICCIMKRHNPFDAFISNKFTNISDLPNNAIVGTSSLRRICQLKNIYPKIKFKTLRGNVNTRLKKLDNKEYDAIILAAAGLNRLGMRDRITDIIPDNICLPAITQGSLGIECRVNDIRTKELISPLVDTNNSIISTAERAVNERLNGNCQTPIAAYATLNNDELYLRALIGKPDGSLILTTNTKGHKSNSYNIGISAAEDLLSKGAEQILQSLD